MESSAKSDTVLVIEDDQAIRDTFVEILQNEGYSVASAGNGQEGVSYLRSHPAPRVIILDLMMPIMNGFEFRNEQAANPGWARIPTIVMSADVRAESRIGEFAPAGYLRKPIDLDELLEAVRRHAT